MQESLFICNFCNQPYDMSNQLPRMITECGHSICLSCITSNLKENKNIFCKQDQREIEILGKTIEDFPKNFILIQLIESQLQMKDKSIKQNKVIRSSENLELQKNKKSTKKKNSITINNQNIINKNSLNEISQCINHDKLLEIFCTNCGKEICYQCGLFGEHKGHNLINLDEIIQEKNGFFEKYEKLMAKISKDEYYLKTQFVEKDFTNQTHQKMKVLIEKIEKIYFEIDQKLREQRRQVIDKVEYIFEKFGDTLNDNIEEHLEKIEGLISPQKNYLQKKMKEIENQNNEVKIYVEIMKSGGLNFLNLLENASDEYRNLINKMTQQVNQIMDQFDVNPITYVVFPGADLIIPDLNMHNTSFEVPNNPENNDSILTLGKKQNQEIFQIHNSKTDSSYKNSNANVQETSPSFTKFNESKYYPMLQVDFSNVKNRKRLTAKVHDFSNEFRQDFLKTSQRKKKFTAKKQELPESNKMKPFIMKKQIQFKNIIKEVPLLTSSKHRKRLVKSSHLMKERRKISIKQNLESMKNTQILDMDHQELNEDSLPQLIEFLNQTSTLKILILANNCFTDNCIKIICQNLEQSKVQTIDFSGNLLTSLSLDHFIQLIKKNQHIKNIICENCPINEKSSLKYQKEFQSFNVNFQF